MTNISLQELGIKGTEDWFFGCISRDHANEILLKEEVGVFLIRASRSQVGKFALSVRDNHRANHYQIDVAKRLVHEGYKFKIGQNEFPAMPQLIAFYRQTKLMDSTLTVPATKQMYRAKFDFKVDPNAPDAAENLALRRGDCVFFLNILSHPDGTETPEWWHVIKRRSGESGLVPAAYLQLVPIKESQEKKFQALSQLNFPFDVLVARERLPNIFDPTQLRLEVGDVVEVQKADEQQPEFWFGFNRSSNKRGLFPFNYVQPLDAATGRLSSQSFSARFTLVGHSVNSSGNLLDAL